MLNQFLVVTRLNRGHYNDRKVRTYEFEKDVKDLVGRIASGSREAYEDPETIQYIYEVDLDNGTMKRLEPALENMKIVLKEMEK